MVPAVTRRPRRGATRDIRYEVPVKAAPERVYAALTSARELTRWWLLGAETDARNAGRLRMVWPKAKAGFGERHGFFVDLEPGRKVAWMWEPARGEKGVPPLSSFFINPRLKNCELSLLHAGFPSAADADPLYAAYARGWEDCVAKLKLYIETGKTCKDELIDLETARILSRRKR
jgi:uncharacterized protein YndB with AHSA1/START domain